MSRTILFVFVICVFISCGKSKKSTKDVAIARVYDKYLYKSQIEGIVPANLSSADSQRIVSDHIDKWVRKQLLVSKAEQNLKEEEKDVEQRIEDYRSSLLIFKYEENIINHRLDTIVTDQQMLDYYTNNSPNFILNNHLAKGVFIQVAKTAPNIPDIRRWYASSKADDLKNLESYCFKNATKYEYFDEHWKYFNTIYQSLPETYERAENILKLRKKYEAYDSAFFYFVKISDYKLAGSIAPYEFVKNDIRNILLNKRRIQLIQDIEADIYNDALNHDNFKIY
jgi:hypothetical protein